MKFDRTALKITFFIFISGLILMSNVANSQAPSVTGWTQSTAYSDPETYKEIELDDAGNVTFGVTLTGTHLNLVKVKFELAGAGSTAATLDVGTADIPTATYEVTAATEFNARHTYVTYNGECHENDLTPEPDENDRCTREGTVVAGPNKYTLTATIVPTATNGETVNTGSVSTSSSWNFWIVDTLPPKTTPQYVQPPRNPQPQPTPPSGGGTPTPPPVQQNNAPVFSDGTATTRSIAENTASGVSIGATVSATDADNDTLTYTLGGTDAGSFSIDSTTGQLRTSAALDYETKTSYSVTVSVSDGNGGSDSITVSINITDVVEGGSQPPTPPPGGEGTQQPSTPPVQPPSQQQPDASVEEDTQPTGQPPTNNQGSGGGGRVISTPKPADLVNHTIKPFDYDAEGVGKVVFSEWMLSKLNDMPQWIEVYNTTDKNINLQGWKIVGRFKDGNGNIRILEPHTLTSQVVKAKKARVIAAYSATHYSGSSSNNIQGEVYLLEVFKRLWIGKAIVLELQDSEGTPIDRIGNLNAQDEVTWYIPYRTRDSVNKERRISLIRRLKSVESRQYNLRFGMTAFGWFPANDVETLTEGKRSLYYYGHPTDIGTPGYRTEGADPLPVTLSSFIPQIAESGEVVLNWTTASEIENAGFNIFRSEAEQGAFVKINASLIQGAGTTSDRNAYTWIDTTAKPNVEYYYRIEDMSFDGISEVLTTQRLKGIFTAKNRTLTRWAIVKKGTE
ncbi:MAG: cadherin domain-containing protein [Candidatus Poribacteria bacterium]|nr:cadherin domain-containing protein [Candidatus Poribacteria bacterium]